MFSSHIFKVTEVIQTQGDGLSNLLYPLGTIQHIMVNSNFIWSLENRGNNRCIQIIWKKTPLALLTRKKNQKGGKGLLQILVEG